jgi:hypothetical protein
VPRVTGGLGDPVGVFKDELLEGVPLLLIQQARDGRDPQARGDLALDVEHGRADADDAAGVLLVIVREPRAACLFQVRYSRPSLSMNVK